MPLELTQIKEILKTSKNRNSSLINAATLQENRLRLHCETTLSQASTSGAITPFLDFVKTLLPQDKFSMFLSLFRYPVPTVNLCDKIFTALEKIFDGRNPVFKYEFTSPEHAEDWQIYRTQVLNEPAVWKTKAFETMKTAINSIMIVDLPSEQTSERPEPYWYFLPFEHVVTFEMKDDECFKYIIFKQPDNKYAVFCDGYFRVIENIEGTEAGFTVISEVSHDLGFCPARFFWTTPINQKDTVVKKSPLSNQLGKLDMLLFYEISNEHLNLYGRYPIYSAFTSDCSFSDDESGNYCDSGYLKNRDGMYLLDQTDPNKLLSCPVCASKRLDGPGSFVEIEPPSKRNGNADLRNPVQITSIDRDSLEYNNEDLAERAFMIYNSVTGYHGMSINNKAVNKEQVKAIFESLESALKSPQTNFEQAQTWITSTICLLRYGPESFQSASISYGTEHFIMTADQLLDMYNKAKETSFSVSTLDMLEDWYHETEFKNNPERLQRQKILTNVDPFRHLTLEEVASMYKEGQIKFEDYMIKMNFSSFIMRFERENMSILEFASGVSYDQKITAIQTALKAYAEEMRPEERKQASMPVLETEGQPSSSAE